MSLCRRASFSSCGLFVIFVGTVVLAQSFSGDASDNGSTSAPLIEYVKTLPVATTTTVETSASPVYVGQPVTFTARVRWNHGTPPDGELVTFKDVTNQVVLGTAPLSSGVAQFTTSSLAIGTHTIKAKYPGDGTGALSNATLTQLVQRYQTTTGLRSSLNPSNFGQAVTFTAQVTGTAPGAPTGTVTFYKGTTMLGTAPLSSGAAQWTTSTLGVGANHRITGVYSGDTSNKSSTSAVLTQVVN